MRLPMSSRHSGSWATSMATGAAFRMALQLGGVGALAGFAFAQRLLGEPQLADIG